MQVEVKRLAGSQVELKISVEPETVKEEIEKIFRATAKRVNVPGFRPGKAPRALIEANVNMEAVTQEALDEVINSSYRQALEETKLDPIERAQIKASDLREDGGLDFEATVWVMPEVKLGEYKGLKAKKTLLPVTEEAVTSELDRLRRRYASYASDAEHPIEKGDLVVISYSVEVEGQVVEEAGVKGYPLEVGADTLFPELNESLLGAKMGETKQIESHLPDTYPIVALAGKDAVFIVMIEEVKKLAVPELDDDFARRIEGIENLEQLREKMQAMLQEAAASQAEVSLRENLSTQATEAAEVEVPQVMVERYVESREKEATEQLEWSGEELESYLAKRGLSYAAWKQGLEREAKSFVKNFLVLREIAKQEGITVSPEELEAEVAALAAISRVSPEEKLRELQEKDALDDIAQRLGRRKVLQLLVDNAVVEEETLAAGEGQSEAPEHGKE